MRNFNSIKLCIALLLTTVAAIAHAEDSALDEARALIQKRDYQAAYQLLEPLESARAGEADYDYLLGVAAVESGNASRGAFALERVLAAQPNHVDARAEMAKAHFMLGETEASKSEFGNVLSQNPDAATQSAIQRLLTEIQKIEGKTTTFGAFLEFGLGYDTNVNSAASLDSVSVPALGGLIIPLGRGARELSDNFFQFAGGLSFRHPLSEKFAVFGAVSSSARINYDESEFDTSTLDFSGGAEFKPNDNNRLTLTVQDNDFSLDGEDFRRARGVSGQWLHTLDARNQVGAFVQYSGLTYDHNSVRNADRTIAGINYGHAFAGDWQPILFASIYGGYESARARLFDFLSQKIVGARAGGQLNFNSRWQGFATLGYENRDYQDRDPVFFANRLDQQYDISIGANYRPARLWTIRPQLSYTELDSNIRLNEFDRTIFSVTVRKDFNW